MTDNNSPDTLTQRILVVDDDARLRSLLQRFLEDDGFVVRTAHDGSQMDKLMQRELFSLVVLDLMLPGEDGISICQRLREDNGDIPIIMLTAKGGDADRIAGLEAGADDYLPKPFNPKELLARIKAVLRRQNRELRVHQAIRWKWLDLVHGRSIYRLVRSNVMAMSSP